MKNNDKIENIRKESRIILKHFSEALGNVKVSERKFKKELSGFREEREGSKCDSSFREIMFKNAPVVDEDCIIAEKAKW